jgi:hypothetical protein
MPKASNILPDFDLLDVLAKQLAGHAVIMCSRRDSGLENGADYFARLLALADAVLSFQPKKPVQS